jgi:ABC-type Fe3+-hydroxamate transport system substrate-binding protein
MFSREFEFSHEIQANMSKSPFWMGNDATGRSVQLLKRPERIISLVPSQTELLVDLGVAERLVGRTRYCIHPREKLSSVAVVGGTKRVEFAQIEVLRPDLILAEKEETPKELVDSLSAVAPVYVTDVVSIPSAISMCREVGEITGLATEAHALAQEIESAMSAVKNDLKGALRPDRVLYLIWRKPWMAASEGTFIHSCLEQIGFVNAASSAGSPGSVALSGRYPELSPDAIVSLRPDRIFLSSEPFPFQEKHAEEIREFLPNARIEFVDGELFSWYGSRMLKMPAYWRKLANLAVQRGQG